MLYFKHVKLLNSTHSFQPISRIIQYEPERGQSEWDRAGGEGGWTRTDRFRAEPRVFP